VRITRLTCPRGGTQTDVGHMAWSALMCGRLDGSIVKDGCGAMIDKRDWIVDVSPRSRKRAQTRNDARLVAMDAMLEGRVADGEKILRSRKTRLTTPQAKMIAGELIQRADFAGALRVLMGAMSARSAERAFAALNPNGGPL